MYEWNAIKNIMNLKAHGITFADATKIFNDPFILEYFDEYHSIDEERYIAIGDAGKCIILAVVFTDRKGRTRIISARKATPKERKRYYDNIKTKT